MKKALAIILALILVSVMAAGCGGDSAEPIDIVVEEPSVEDGVDDNGAYDGPLVGTWSDVESGFHGNAGYYWSFDRRYGSASCC